MKEDLGYYRQWLNMIKQCVGISSQAATNFFKMLQNAIALVVNIAFELVEQGKINLASGSSEVAEYPLIL